MDNMQHNPENMAATQELFKTIKVFAGWLDQNYAHLNFQSQLTEIVHREGINIRYLGRLRSCVTQPYLKEVLLNEMVAR
jgi:hypothetical protein